MDVCHRRFDDFGEYLSSLVICSDTNFRLFFALGKSRWKLHGALLGKPVLRVGFMSVFIAHRNTGLA